MNVVVLRGVLSSEPRTKELPSGAVLVNWEVTTPTPEGKRTVPVTWFDPPKSVIGHRAGAEVVVVGVVRRRFYRAAGRTASATEVVATGACRASHRMAAVKLVDRAIAALEPVAV